MHLKAPEHTEEICRLGGGQGYGRQKWSENYLTLLEDEKQQQY